MTGRFRGLMALPLVVGMPALAHVAWGLPSNLRISLAVNVGLSVLGFIATSSIVATLGPTFIKANLRGIDLNKETTKRDSEGNLVRPIEGIAIPESQGTITAAVYILVLSVFIPFAFASYELDRFPHAEMAEYLAAVLTITFASFMGFADDVIDLRWRYKIPIPFLATLPLLSVYYANGNHTGVMVPNQFRWLFGDFVELGLGFYLFLLWLAVFSTHAINIYAGVNGLEVGQSVVIAASVLVLNILQLLRIPEEFKEYRENHMQSIFLIVPFLAVSLSLLQLNWFPAQVFVGDTYCYFAGMTFAVVSIVGHFSKTMVLLLIPQLLNFLYSCPQLFPFIGIPCPRHRMPTFNVADGTVCNSFAEFTPEELKPLGKLAYMILKNLRLVHVRSLKEGQVQMSNLTLINFVLYVFGPCREDVLCCRLLAIQVASTLMCFALRFGLASYLFDVVL
ncbi:unnamed protein product [Durusdinium trenchii]|uniref:UDP-N-acetylglucosamine--dolichyl-phosphate N-acetylglucosaminephosphotransferase n=1 Tax=Durusdinium trenchii TaxID=1381693 RepID=A0ABP0SS54_9DINO